MVAAGQILSRQRDGRRLRVGSVLGAGGEGTVYLCDVLDGPPETVALKWYHLPGAGSSRLERLKELVKLEPPSDRFLWPETIVTAPQEPTGLGYAMRLRPSDFVRFDAVVARPDALPFATLATIGRNLADSFHALHIRGLCYRDIKDANIFAQISDGEVLICDNDNVALEGSPATVRGSLYFMAPEVMRGDVRPSRRSDQFSLAVLLFYLLVHHHPLEGKRTLSGAWDDAAQMDALAMSPLFVFDPSDASNSPDPDLQPLPLAWWPVMPSYVRSLFARTFGPGLSDPGKRVPETQWRDALDDMRSAVVTCRCGASNIGDASAESQRCWAGCGQQLPEIPMLRPARPRGSRPGYLDVGTTLTRANVDGSLLADHRQVFATVERHPERPDTWGLRNESTRPWAFREAAGGSVFEIQPGRALRLRDGTIDFGYGHNAAIAMPEPMRHAGSSQ